MPIRCRSSTPTRDEVVETISTRPAPDLLFGSAPNALAFGADGKTLYVSNGTNNAVAVVAFDPPHSRLLGCLPTGWYPAGLAVDPERQTLVVANIKGNRHANIDGERETQSQGQDRLGIQLAGPPGHGLAHSASRKRKTCREHTATVLANNRLSAARLAELKPRKDAPPLPVPERIGEPSVIKHVLYIIKENRTYDQVFGDMPQGEGDRGVVHLRQGSHAQSAQAGRGVRAVGQFLLQRRARAPTAISGPTRPT